MNCKTQSILHAARGPVLLITIGVLFAMDQAGWFSFGRTWPLILIVIGVMKLLERTAAPPTPPAQPYVPPVAPPYAPPPPYGPPPPYTPPSPYSQPYGAPPQPPPPPGTRR